MSKALGMPTLKRSSRGETFRVAILRLSRKRQARFFQPSRARTFPWYLAHLRIALEGSLHPLRPCSQIDADDHTILLAREVVGIMWELVSDHNVIPPAALAARTLRKSLGSVQLYDRVAHRVIADVAEHLKNAEDAVVLKGGRRVHKLPRRTPRSRSKFPDPDQPAWATVNRMPSRKLQMPCRVEPDIKKRIEDEAAGAGVSQSRWLEEAIAEKLQRQGHPVYLSAPTKASKEASTTPRRIRRARLPEPEKSRGCAANRADQVTTVRIGNSLAARIDKKRGQKHRSVWMSKAVRAFFDSGAKLPASLGPPEALSIAVSLSLDREVFSQVGAAAASAGITKSEWLRRIVFWYLVVNK